ncbi:hypothetical protein BSZ35_07400 [Salinibacter sp. 10B]|uniref:DUF2914 domain-containing protein n=1 Tax=Salinibacter sp. 10B TaxID=1923971 RepID=UPI000CF56F4D|nr:DUF2914 domain-containing protein [Salinibacter sp. 10B]PQJ34449.1 hypothetical protein BSZ35_07400 [Salinibacter sp. 10B]
MSTAAWTTRLTEWLGTLLDWLEHNRRYRWARLFLHRHEHAVPPSLFLGGVTWDVLTLQRIDAVLDNLILGAYLVLLGGFVVIATLDRNDRPMPGPLQKLSRWAPGMIQFLAGGLFSAYVIYYTRSASFSTASLFLLVLVALLVANELLWSRVLSSYLLLGVYFLAVFCYFTFFLPTVLGKMGFGVFLTSGFLSAGLVISLILYLDTHDVFETSWAFSGAVGTVLGLLGLVVLFYVNHWIPPVPLAMKEGGVYHDVERDNGAFVLRYEEPAWYWPWKNDDDPFRYAPGDTVHCFAAVFAPTDLQTKVYHHWQYYNEERDVWVDTDRIGYEVVGGRRNGYRGVTFKRHVHPGEWRVTVETVDRRPIARIRFDVVEADTSEGLHYTTRRYR